MDNSISILSKQEAYSNPPPKPFTQPLPVVLNVQPPIISLSDSTGDDSAFGLETEEGMATMASSGSGEFKETIEEKRNIIDATKENLIGSSPNNNAIESIPRHVESTSGYLQSYSCSSEAKIVPDTSTTNRSEGYIDNDTSIDYCNQQNDSYISFDDAMK